MMQEKTIGVELADGTKVDATFRRILRKERRELSRLIAPKEINTNSPDFKVDFEKWEEYRERYVIISLRSPDSLKTQAALQNLPDASFNAMFLAAQEVNGEISQESTEKK